MDRNNTNFATLLAHYYATTKPTDDPIVSHLRRHQYVLYAYLKGVMSGEIGHQANGFITVHEPGLGKTILALVLADLLKKLGYGTLLLAPKSLESNFQSNLDRLRSVAGDTGTGGRNTILEGGKLDKTGIIPDKDFEFVSINASDMITQLKRIGNVKGDLKHIRLRDVLKGRCIIIDEAHILANSITNGSEQAVELYNEIIACGRTIFCFPLTGSFMVNSPFEAAPLFNMVLGRDYFPTDRDKFMSLFGSVELLDTNRAMLQNMCSGLVSVVKINRNDPAIAARFPEELPTKVISLPMTDEQLGKYITSRNQELDEQKDWAVGRDAPTGSTPGFGKDDKVASTYRMKSRKASNGINKWEWLTKFIISKPTELTVVYMPFINEGGIAEYVEHLKTHAKYAELVVNKAGIVLSGPPELRGKHYAAASVTDATADAQTTADVAVDGSAELRFIEPPKPFDTDTIGRQRVRERDGTDEKYIRPPGRLEVMKTSAYSGKSADKLESKLKKTRARRERKKESRHISFGADEVRIFDKKETAETVGATASVKDDDLEIRYYCIFTGETEVEVRQHLINIMSDPRNIHGRFCHVFFVSSTGTTGINICGGRNVISTQPFWNWELWNQLKHRIIRDGAADALPANERKVQPYILRSVFGEDSNKTNKHKHKMTTDEELFMLGIKKDQLNRAFIKIIESVTLECLAGVSDSPELCRKCIADGKPLVGTESFWRDCRIPNNCTELDEYLGKDPEGVRSYDIDKHDLEDIEYDGMQFYYQTKNGKLLVYERNHELNKLILMPQGHPYLMAVKRNIEAVTNTSKP